MDTHIFFSSFFSAYGPHGRMPSGRCSIPDGNPRSKQSAAEGLSDDSATAWRQRTVLAKQPRGEPWLLAKLD
jgi:hypothetical protein